jgi:hypothetical protein
MAADIGATGFGLTDRVGSIEPQPPMITTQTSNTQFFIDIIPPLNMTLPLDITLSLDITLPLDITPPATAIHATVDDWTPLWRAVEVNQLAIIAPVNNVATAIIKGLNTRYDRYQPMNPLTSS